MCIVSSNISHASGIASAPCSLLDVGVCRASNYVVLLDPGSSSSPVNTPTATIPPTSSPTTFPTTKIPTMAPAKPPTLSFADLFTLLAGLTRPPTQAPTLAPASSNDDFFSILNAPSQSVPRSTRQPTQVPNVAPTAQKVDFISLLNQSTTNTTETLSVSVEASSVVESSSLYTAGYVIDDVGKDLIIQLGRSVGICSTCGTSGSLRTGLRAEIRGTITELSATLGPHGLAVSSVQLSNNLTSICQPSRRSLTATNDVTMTPPTKSSSYLRIPSV
jgi:hypothetical protein